MASFKVLREKAEKDKYLALPRHGDLYSFEQLQALRNMAEKDIYPDGRFSDQECNIWSMFHNFRMKES